MEGSPKLVVVVAAGSLYHTHHEAYHVLEKCPLGQSVVDAGLAYHNQRLKKKIFVNQDEGLRLSKLYEAGRGAESELKAYQRVKRPKGILNLNSN